MGRTFHGLCVALVTLSPVYAFVDDLDYLPAILPPHPRLVLSDDRLVIIAGYIANDPAAATLLNVVREHGDAIIANPESGDGGLWDAAYTLGFLHRLDCHTAGTPLPSCTTPWGTAGVIQVLRAAQSNDFCGGCGGNCTAMGAFSPRSAGLCYANLAQGLAIGYDWLHWALSPAQRSTVAGAITNQLLDVYAEGITAAFVGSYWYESRDNYNAAVNAGAVIASLAVLDFPSSNASSAPLNHTASYAADTLRLALIALQRGITVYPPEGGGLEGPTYYTFGVQHLIAMYDALETATGGFLELPPLPDGGRFMIDHATPNGRYYPWGDGGCTQPDCDMAVFNFDWVTMSFARRSGDLGVAWYARQQAAALNATWGSSGHWDIKGTRYLIDWAPGGTEADYEALPKGWAYPSQGLRLAFLRTAWQRGAASGTFLAAKGGDNHLQQIGASRQAACVARPFPTLAVSWWLRQGDDAHRCGRRVILPRDGGRAARDRPRLRLVLHAAGCVRVLVEGCAAMHGASGRVILAASAARCNPPLPPHPTPCALTLAGYFALQRFGWYRKSSAGHNTLQFGGAPQDSCTTWGPTGDPDACQAPLAAFNLTNASSGDGWATFNLTGVYTASAANGGAGVARGVALLPAGSAPLAAPRDVVLIRDEFGQSSAASVTWALHTYANVTLDGARPGWALLSAPGASGSTVSVEVQADTTAATGCHVAAFQVEGIYLAPPQEPSTGLSRLLLVVPSPATHAGCGALTVLVSPVGSVVVPTAFSHVSQLAEWPTLGPWGGPASSSHTSTSS